MTSDPKAPGADAVYLKIEEIENDPDHFRSYYARIKVLKEEGKELARVEIPGLRSTDKLSNVRGRTIHADGTIIPLTVRSEDLKTVQPTGTNLNETTFTLPSVEVGSILEYSYQIVYEDTPLSVLHSGLQTSGSVDLRTAPYMTVFGANAYWAPTWEIQKPYFVHSSHYEFKPFSRFMNRNYDAPANHSNADSGVNIKLTDERGREVRRLLWWQRLPQGVTVKTISTTGYIVDATDIPPLPHEQWMPPLESMRYEAGFFYCYEVDAYEYLTSEAKAWSDDLDKIAMPSAAITSEAGRLTSADDSELSKAKKLYDLVESFENADFTRGGEKRERKPVAMKRPENTLADKRGSSEDIATLYLAMLRAAGISAYAIRVIDRDRNTFNPGSMNPEDMNSTLVYFSAGGQQILLDPGEKMCPFQTVSWRHSNVKGIAQSARGASEVTTPEQDYRNNVSSRAAHINIDALGRITGNVEVSMTGQEAMRWRQLSLQNDVEKVKSLYESELQNVVPECVEVHVDHFTGMDDPYSKLIAVVNVTGSYSLSTEKTLELPAFFFDSRGDQPFVKENNREEPVDLHYGNRVSNSVTYILPAGMAALDVPDGVNISWPGRASFIAVTASSPGKFVVTDSLATGFTELQPEEYQNLHGFYQKVAAAVQKQVSLKASIPE